MADDKNIELQIRAKNLTQEAFEKVKAAVKALDEQTQTTTSKGSTSWGKWFATIGGGVAVGNLLSEAFKTAGGYLASIPGELIELGKRGNDVADVRESFTKLTSAIGETSGAVLGQLRTAFGGTVTDYDLMKASNTALSKGLVMTGGDMATVAKAARVMADQVGGPAKDKFESMIAAVASGRAKELRQLPLDYANIERATKKYADTLGVEVGALTVSQQRHALQNGVLEESKRILRENGEVQNDFNDNLAAGAAQWQNWKDRIGEAIAASPALNVALTRITEAMTSAFGSDQEAQVKSITRLIGQTAIAAVGAASFIVSSAQLITSAYFKARAAVDQFFDAFNQREVARVEALIKTYEAVAATSTSATSQSKLRLQELRIELAGLKGYSEGLANDANDALVTNDRLNKAAGDAKKFMADLAAAMATADAQGGKAKTSSDGLAASLRKQREDGVDPLAKSTKDYADKVRKMGAEVADAIKHGSLESWAKRNAAALLELVQRSAELGKKLPDNLRKAFFEASKIGLDQEAGKRTEDILKAQLDAVQKGLDRRNSAWQRANDQILTSEKSAADIRARLTMTSFDYQIYVIQQEQAARKQALDATASNYQEALAAIDDETRARMEELRKAFNPWLEALDTVAGALRQLEQVTKGVFSSIVGGLSRVLDGWAKYYRDIKKFKLQGGATPADKASAIIGGAAGVIGATGSGSTGQRVVGGAASGAIGGLATAGAFAATGAATGSVVPIVGTAIGAGVGALIGYLRARSANKKANEELKALQAELLKTFGSMNNLRQLSALTGVNIAADFGVTGAKGLQTFQKDLDAFGAKVAEISTTLNEGLSNILGPVQGLGLALPATLTPYLDHLRELGLLTTENQLLLAGFGAGAEIDYHKMQDAAERYGISLDALGPGFKNAKMHETALQILNDLDLLQRGGADMNGVLHGMADEISAVAQDSIKFGTDIPGNMRPWMQALIDSGELIDANGVKITDISKLHFGDDIKFGLDAIVLKLQELIDKLGLVPGAIKAIPRDVDVTVRGHYREDDEGPMPEHAKGAYIRRDHTARVHAGEIIAPEKFFRRMFENIGGTPTGGGGDLTVRLVLPNGRVITETVLRDFRSTLSDRGIR